MKESSFPALMLALGIFCIPLPVSAQEWLLVQGPRTRDSLPLPVLWASQVWEAVYRSGGEEIEVYGLNSRLFLLEGAQPLDCPDVSGRTRTWEGRSYVHLPGGFLVVFPQDYRDICGFLKILLAEWERLQGVNYYRGRITLPAKITPESRP